MLHDLFSNEIYGAFNFFYLYVITVFALTCLSFRIAYNGLSYITIIADKSQASWQEVDWILADINASRFRNTLKPSSPFLVANSWSSEGYNLNVIEFFSSSNVNITECSQSSS